MEVWFNMETLRGVQPSLVQVDAILISSTTTHLWRDQVEQSAQTTGSVVAMFPLSMIECAGKIVQWDAESA